MTRLPDFFIVGAAKAGTTALYLQLLRSPQVFMPVQLKEPNFFLFEGESPNFRANTLTDDIINKTSVWRLEDYAALFAPALPTQIAGEASPSYLYYPQVAERIHQRLPNAKIVAMLRNPVDRAYSAFMFQVSLRAERVSTFEEGLALEAQRISDRWSWMYHYRQMGYYSDQIARYYQRFPKENIHVCIYEEFCDDPTRVVCDLAQFLGIDPQGFVGGNDPAAAFRPHPSGIPSNPLVNWLYDLYVQPNPLKQALKRWVPKSLGAKLFEVINRKRSESIVKAPLAAELRSQLAADYREDILKLQDLLGRDLSRWLR